jgi:hypothetical protein
MARNFPHVRVLGVDIAPAPITVEQSPENLRFEIDDINFGLEHHKNSFELVHMRCVGAGLPNYAQGILLCSIDSSLRFHILSLLFKSLASRVCLYLFCFHFEFQTSRLLTFGSISSHHLRSKLCKTWRYIDRWRRRSEHLC